LPLLNLIRFLSAQLSSLPRSRWMAAQPAGVSTTPPSFVSPANLLRVHSNSSSRSLMKKLNKTGLSTDPGGHHQLQHLAPGTSPGLHRGSGEGETTSPKPPLGTRIQRRSQHPGTQPLAGTMPWPGLCSSVTAPGVARCH